MRPNVLPCFLGFWLFVSCGGNTSPPVGQASPLPTETGKESTSSAGEARQGEKVDLAEDPRMDLIHNRFLWHLYRPGLYLPLAGEGFRKYTQEYNNPWGKVLEVEGREGRVLSSRGAVLRFPWEEEGEATLLLRVLGAAGGQRITLHINEKHLGNVDLTPGWQIARVPVRAGLLRAGENELRLSVAKKGSAGGASTYGLYHSIEVVPGAAPEEDLWPPLSPQKDGLLGGFPKMEILLEIPASAWLRVTPTGTGSFQILTTSVTGETKTLLSRTQRTGEEKEMTLPLADYEGELIKLSFLTEGEQAFWGNPFIGLTEMESRPRPPVAKNGIVFVVDALRSDRLSVYNPDTRVKTPRITQAVQDYGAVLLYNQAASPSSPPSHGSIQTGMIPRVHGVAGDTGELKPGTPMISTVLREVGVATAYYGNNPFGMARLEKPGRWTEFHQPLKEGKGIDCVPLVEGMLDFAERQTKAGKRFFISALPYEPHTPYRYHEGITDRFYKGPWDPVIGKSVDGVLTSKISAGKLKPTENQWQQLFALYDGEVEYMDSCFGQLLDGLSTLGQLEDTAIIITSDHGEGMFEHGKGGHAFGHYSELSDVPFIVLFPKLDADGLTVKTVSSHLDIAPTLLDLMGVERPKEIQGESILPLILREGKWTPRVISLEYGRSFALRAMRWKYIVGYDQKEELYDLKNDPTEQTEVREKYPMVHRYFRDIAGFFLAHRSSWRMSTWGTLNNHGPGFLEYLGVK